jgi:hypothetical protein
LRFFLLPVLKASRPAILDEGRAVIAPHPALVYIGNLYG